MASHDFIDTIVDDFPDHVMQTFTSCITDVHSGTLAHRIKTF
jgi:hypothetical protein